MRFSSYIRQTQDWASTFPLFHWGPIAWGIYIVLAVAFGFMMHIRSRNKQRFSEACRPILGKKVDGVLGKVIDVTCVVALLCGTATTFSVTTPLLSAGISRVFELPNSVGLVIMILILIAVVYTITVLFGIKGISKLASFCVYLFFALLIYVFATSGQSVYIFETGVSGIGNMIQNFIGLSTYTDPLRLNSFPQNWTIYYWAYWMAWCIATPFFIAVISKGRTIRNIIIGCYTCGLSGTFMSFIVLGGFGLGQQMKNGTGLADVIYNADFSINYEEILNIFNQLPWPEIGIIAVVLSMIMFYATTFDTLTMVVANYSYKIIKTEETASKAMRTFWSIIFIIFPIALLFSENTLSSLQSVSIIAAFPIGIIMLLVIASFFKDAKLYLKEIGYKDSIIECPVSSDTNISNE
ncbi:MAG: BCCT family transporter [Clostridia bacterium]|nr:BCCT family transporter [Clostridia bacterium]